MPAGGEWVCGKKELPGGFRGHVLAMEFVRDGADVLKIVGPPGHPKRAALRRKIEIDFVWIACYSLLFALVAVLLAARQFHASLYLAVVAVVCALSAAGFDVAENRGMLRALEVTPEEATAAALRGIREAALLKWALSYVAMGLLATAFFGHGWGVSLVGYCFAAAAMVGFAGLWHNPSSRSASRPSRSACSSSPRRLWRARTPSYAEEPFMNLQVE